MIDQIQHARDIFSQNERRVFLIEPSTGKTKTFGEVANETLSIASELIRYGVAPGDRLCFISINCLELSHLYFAAWHCGAVVVPLNPQLSTDYIGEILASAAPRLVFANPDVLRQHAAALDQVPNAKVLSFVPLSHAERLASEKLSERAKPFGVWDVSNRDKTLRLPFERLEASDVFLRIYTSGSTAAPKGIDIAFERLLGNERLFCSFMGITKENRFFNILPMSYLGGVHNLLLLPFSVGASVVISEPLGGANLYGFWETVKTYSINTLWFTAAMLNMLMSLRDEGEAEWTTNDISLALVGMAPLAGPTRDAFQERFRIKLYENYALSETLFVTSRRPQEQSRPESKGRLMPGIVIDIQGPDGMALPDGETGEIFVRSPYLLAGYINASSEDLANIRADGFATGDIGHFDKGELFVTGRKKDLIIRGGLNIAPATVENVLAGLAEVDEAAVVAIPDPVYGEAVAAAVTLKPGAARPEPKELIKISAQKLAQFHKIEKLIIVDQIPKGMTGKIDKTQVRRLIMEAGG